MTEGGSGFRDWASDWDQPPPQAEAPPVRGAHFAGRADGRGGDDRYGEDVGRGGYAAYAGDGGHQGNDDYDDYDDYDEYEDLGEYEDHGPAAGPGPAAPAGYGAVPPGYGAGPGRPVSYRTPRPPRRRRRRGGALRGHPILRIVGVLVLAVVVLAGAGIIYVEKQINPGGKPGPKVSVVIPASSSTATIGRILASDGVIHNGTLFAYYVRLHGDGPLLAGSYTLPKNLSYSTAIAALEKGPVIVTATLVVPEGFTLNEIAAAVGRLPHMGLSSQKFLTAATDGTVRSPYEPAGTNSLEGLLFPATYTVRQGESEVQLLEEMVATFDDRASSLGLDAAAQKLGYTPYQVVAVASIIEKEAKLAPDRPLVASTIYNRLRVHMTLGADSTQTYWLRLSDPTLGIPTVAQLEQPSPYNTRLNPGLPPTPIANPGLASLGAASSPASTTYLYFVEINNDGKLGFASDNSGFTQLQAQCRAANLC